LQHLSDRETYKLNLNAASTIEEKVDVMNSYALSLLHTDRKEAFAIAKETSQLALLHDYTKGYAYSLHVKGQCHEYHSEYPEAMETALQALELFREMDDVKGESDMLNVMGGVYNYLGDHEKRLETNMTCLELRKNAGDTAGVLSSMNNIGDTYMSLGKYNDALKYFSDCLELGESGTKTRTVVTYNIGEVCFHQKDKVSARKHLTNACDLANESDYPVIIVLALNLLAEMDIWDEQFNIALEQLNRAEALAEKIGFIDQLYSIYRNKSYAYEGLGNVDEAYDYYQQFHKSWSELYGDANIKEIKNIQFRYQRKRLQEETAIEKEKNIRLKRALDQIELQKEEIAVKNQAITDSIVYAKYIQQAILPSNELLDLHLQDYFVFYRAKDIVSGDFYWLEQKEDKVIFAAVDCTGHGVPGAFVSIVGNNGLKMDVNVSGLTQPANILNHVNTMVRRSLGGNISHIRDGMDLALCTLDRQQNTLEYAGANNPLWLVRKKEEGEPQLQDDQSPKPTLKAENEHYSLWEFAADKQSIELFSKEENTPFTNHSIQLLPGDTFYIFTDGYADQFGGKNEAIRAKGGRKYSKRKFRELLLSIQEKSMQQQSEKLAVELESWQGELGQVDDICIVGVRV
jgi:serine phosphatase RsbU (regulator of sigma subunit)